MTKQRKIYLAKALTVLAVPVLLYASASGPDPGKTGGIPGEGVCAECHLGTPVNGGPGRVTIILQGTNYTPGVKQRITVRVEDPNQRRWGFQLTARLQSNPKTQAGSFTILDSNATQLLCTNTNLVESFARPCPAEQLQFVEHKPAGTAPNTTGGASWDVDWTPPATDFGPIDFYSAGNAANFNLENTGDRIYTTKATLTPAASVPKPAISSTDGVVNGASFRAGIAPNTWVTIRGTNLASSTRIWAGSDFNDSNLPTALDGTSAKINGKDAFVYFISPTQINVLAPANETSTGPVQATVTTPGGTSDAATAQMQTVSPAFFQFNNGTDPAKYIAATHVDGTFTGPNGLYPTAPALTTPAKPGEIVVLYATGFGQTNPPIPNGQIVTAPAPLVTQPTFTIGGVSLAAGDVSFAGQSATGLYQFNVKVPDSIGNGDQKVVAAISGQSTPDAFIFVQK